MDDDEVWSQLWRMTRSGEKRPRFIGLALTDAEEAVGAEHLRVRCLAPPPTQRGGS